MAKFDRYFIYFSGLKDGKHDFKFEIDTDLFVYYGNNEIIEADLSVDVVLEKKSDHLAFHFNINGIVKTNCDRCLGTIELEINDSPELYISFGELTSDITDIDDNMILSRSEDKIDLSKHFFDYIVLNLPIKKIHPEDENGKSTCDPDMLNKLKEYLASDSKKKEIDPRWEKLKTMFN